MMNDSAHYRLQILRLLARRTKVAAIIVAELEVVGEQLADCADVACCRRVVESERQKWIELSKEKQSDG